MRSLLIPILLAGVLIACRSIGDVDGAGAGRPIELTVVTLNLWHDQNDWPRRQVLIVDALAQLQPDVIVLQEVLQHETLPNQAASLAQRLGYGHHFVATEPEDAPRRYGNAILSRHPILARGGTKLQPFDDYRTAAYVRIDVNGLPVDVYGMHLHHTAEGAAIRRQQVDDLLAFVRSRNEDAPLLLAGDFNAAAQAPELSALHEGFFDVYGAMHARATAENPTTLNPDAGHPPRRIDHVFAERGRFTPLSARIILDRPGDDGLWPSDHFGVVARLRFDANP